MATKSEVAKLMGVIAAAFPSFVLKQETITVYAEMLKDVDYALLEAAAKQVMTEDSPFFPSLGHWRQTAFDLAEKSAGVPSAFEAWNEVWEAVTHLWTHEEPQWSHPLIAQTVKVVGFNRLCYANLDEVGFERANFYKVYESLLQRARDDVRMLPDVKAASGMLADGIKSLAEGMRK